MNTNSLTLKKRSWKVKPRNFISIKSVSTSSTLSSGGQSNNLDDEILDSFLQNNQAKIPNISTKITDSILTCHSDGVERYSSYEEIIMTQRKMKNKEQMKILHNQYFKNSNWNKATIRYLS